MKNLKKLIVCVLTLGMVAAMSPVNILAAETIHVHEDIGMENLTILGADKDGDNGVAPCYNTVCGNYASHRMVARGFGYVDNPNGTSYITAGCAWQCSRCMLVMVTEGDLYYTGMDIIGKYATYSGYSYPINTNGCLIHLADYYGYTANTYLDGYQFVKE